MLYFLVYVCGIITGIFIYKIMLTRQQKQEIIQDLAERLSKSKFLTFVDFSGLNVGQLSDLRKKLRETDTELKIAKKTFIDLALTKANLEAIKAKELKGEIGLVFSYGQNEIAPAKALRGFSLKNEALKILGGIMDSNFITKDQIVFLAKISSRDEVLAKLVSSLASPLSGLVNVLNGNLRNFVYLLSNIKK